MPPLSSKSDHPQLHTFLNRDEVRDTGLTAAYFEGFATGVAAGPPMGGIQGFMDLLLGDDPPPFEDENEVQAVMSAVFGRYNELVQVFDTDPTGFQPDFHLEEIEDWATGFGRAMSLDIEAWNDLASDQERGMMLMPILAFARGESTGRPMVEEFEDADAEGRAETASYIPNFVPMIAEHFRAMGAQPGEGIGTPRAASANEEVLQSFLARRDVQDAGVSLSFIDGFVAALAAGPVTLETVDELSTCLLGRDGPSFQSKEEARGVFGAVQQRYGECAWQLDKDSAAYEPIFAPDGDVTAWASGFSRAMMLAPEEWESVLNDEENQVLLTPILPFARDPQSGRTMLEESGETSFEEYAHLSGYIRDAVVAINDYWWGYNAEEETPPPAEAAAPPPQPPPANTNQPRRNKKVGRNEPCPCGSGKKYKKCCGV